jgi:hypothetical protein
MAKVGLLSLIALLQVFVLVSGFAAHREMADDLSRVQWAYKQLVEETGDLHVTFGIQQNPFLPAAGLVLMSLLLTVVLLIDQVQHERQDDAVPTSPAPA